MPTRFNPRAPVSIHNEWPRSKYPIPHGTLVWVRGRHGIYAGRITWYHPSREIDASCVQSAGHPWYKVAGKDLGEHGQNFDASYTRRKTDKGLRELEAICIRQQFSAAGRLRTQLQSANAQATVMRQQWEKRWKRRWRG